MPRTQGHDNGRGRSPEESGGGESGQAGAKNAQNGSGPVKSSHVIEEHIDVGVPRDVAYQQWTTYQDLTKYSKKESAEAKRKERVSFSSKIGPSSRQWDAEVVEQVPGRRIAWRSIGGAQNMGVMTFHRLDDRLTRVMVQMEYHPQGFVETIGNFLRMQRRRVRKDLRLFKNFIELRGEPTGKGADPVHTDAGLRQETDERLGHDSRASGEQEVTERDDSDRHHLAAAKKEPS